MSAYLYSIGATAAIFTLLALSLNIITGYAGQAMMGHAAFFGLGAYTAAILTQTYHMNFLLALLLAMLFTGACGALLGLISLRLQADFLAITTIGINFVMVALFNNMSITGGSLGLTILKPKLFGVKMGNQQFFWLTVAIIVIVCLLIVQMRRSWFGMALASINNDAAAARSFGIDTDIYYRHGHCRSCRRHLCSSHGLHLLVRLCLCHLYPDSFDGRYRRHRNDPRANFRRPAADFPARSTAFRG